MSDKKLSARANARFTDVYGENGEFTLGVGRRKLHDIVENKTRSLVLDLPKTALDGLSPANERALAHLVKAAACLDAVFLKQDHPDNIRAREALEAAAARGDATAREALTVFNIQNGVEGSDLYAMEVKPLRLFRDKKLQPGKGYYPQDLTKKELADYLVAHPEQAAAILSNNTMVRRDGGRLVALPYSVAFREEMEGAARELLAAARETDHEGLKTYLRWQAQALVNDSDAEALFNADKYWIALEDSPLEFTIGRENYDDALSTEVASEPRVKALLEANGIKAKSKDSIGVRVGIVNRDSYAEILRYRRHLEPFSRLMPLSDRYAQTADARMTFADVDLVAFMGDYAAIRGGITLAQNLPNSDKLAVQLNQGSRLVFHRQMRSGSDPAQTKAFLTALVDPEQHRWHDLDSNFSFTVGHELLHSIGPGKTADGQDKKATLGKWGSVLEENKADVGSIFMTGYLVQAGEFSQAQANKIFLTWSTSQLPTKKPSPEEAHRVRSLMQLNYFREKGAVLFEKGEKLRIVPEKMPETARQMLEEIVALQLASDPAAADAFVARYGAWNDALQYAADEQLKLKPRRYRIVEQPVRDALLQTPAF